MPLKWPTLVFSIYLFMQNYIEFKYQPFIGYWPQHTNNWLISLMEVILILCNTIFCPRVFVWERVWACVYTCMIVSGRKTVNTNWHWHINHVFFAQGLCDLWSAVWCKLDHLFDHLQTLAALRTYQQHLNKKTHVCKNNGKEAILCTYMWSYSLDNQNKIPLVW